MHTPISAKRLGLATPSVRGRICRWGGAVSAYTPAMVETSEARGDDMLARIGPQIPREVGLPRRARFHQSWYRAAVLQREYGVLDGSGRSLGSVLTHEDGRAGWNFTTPGAHRLYRLRRMAGWGVEPGRCERYLTSSQALTLNLFGLLGTEGGWLADVLAEVLRRDDIAAVIDTEIEYALPSPSRFLGDKSRVDALIRIATGAGPLCLVVEVKYLDRFNSRKLDLRGNEAYSRLAEASGIWDITQEGFYASAVNQLVRCHAVGASIQQAAGIPSMPILLLLHHPDDRSALSIAAKYRAVLAEETSFLTCGLDRFVAAMMVTAPTAHRVAEVVDLRRRYLELDESEEWWQQHLLPAANGER
jgi:hypothetical protein